MAHGQAFVRRLSTALRWPVGIAVTSWRYMWRTTPVHRWELTGSAADDAAPELPAHLDVSEVQGTEDGTGPLVHRMYRTRIVGTSFTPERLVAVVAEDLDAVAPSEFASFQKVRGDPGVAPGDKYIVRMPGPYDGPVQVVAKGPTSFRLVTLDGHLEAGQIEFRADSDHRSVVFTIESWARSGDRFSDFLYTRLRLTKEVQLHMWTSVLSRVVELSGGQMEGGIVISTRRVEASQLRGLPENRSSREVEQELADLATREVNFDMTRTGHYTPENGWRVDDMIEPLPHEGPGPPVDDGTWQVARRLLIDHQLADPAVVRAVYRAGAPLPGRDMLLRIRFLGVRFTVGVRVGDVYDDTRTFDGRQAQVFGWSYRTLQGHFEEGQMHYEVWKWLDTGDVAFRLHAFSRPAKTGPFLLRLGFRLFGRIQQLRFYRHVCERARRLTEAQLESASRNVRAG